MSNELIDKFNEVKDNLLEIHPYLTVNKNLTNFKSWSISVASPMDMSGLANYDHNTQVIRLLSTEINQNFYKQILQKAFDTSKFDYLDLRSVNQAMPVTTHQGVRSLVELISSNKDYKYLMTGNMIASSLCDSAAFNLIMNTANVKPNGALPNLLGKIGNYDVYVDPFMSFDDCRICLFNEIEINIDNISMNYVNASTFAPRFKIDYDLVINVVGDSKLLFVVDGDTNSKSFRQFNQLQRDIKIDSILDGDK